MFAHTILLSSLPGEGGREGEEGKRRGPLFPSDRVFAEQKLENANLIEKTKRAKKARKEWRVWIEDGRLSKGKGSEEG